MDFVILPFLQRSATHTGLPRLLAYSIAWNKPNFASQRLVKSITALDAQMQGMAANVWHVRYISLYQEICGVDGCADFADGARKIPMMDDEDHLSQFGANLVVRRLVAEGKLR